jgi:hypothetical protein
MPVVVFGGVAATRAAAAAEAGLRDDAPGKIRVIGIDAAVENGDLHAAAVGAHAQQWRQAIQIERLVDGDAVTDAAHVALDLADIAARVRVVASVASSTSSASAGIS